MRTPGLRPFVNSMRCASNAARTLAIVFSFSVWPPSIRTIVSCETPAFSARSRTVQLSAALAILHCLANIFLS
jgi:hypothetical protein